MMQELNWRDRPVERPVYNNEKLAGLHYKGQLSRSEAEVLDIIYAGFVQRPEDDTDPVEMSGTEEQWESSCVALVHEGMMIPIINLEETILQSGMLAEKWLVCKQAAIILYDILLTLIKDDEHGKE